jgi:hypothetical protein
VEGARRPQPPGCDALSGEPAFQVGDGVGTPGEDDLTGGVVIGEPHRVVEAVEQSDDVLAGRADNREHGARLGGGIAHQFPPLAREA